MFIDPLLVLRYNTSVFMGILYLVATPIGNLQDITLRALSVLKQAALVAAEDTRTARQLLSHFEITTPVTSYFEHNKLKKLAPILHALERGDVAMISEAGTPGLSDPGYELVRAAIANSIQVVPIPGPSALIAALVASGLSTDQFIYLGFLPRQPTARRKLLQALATEIHTLVAFEAPHRIRASLEDVERVLGNREICIARELTKLYEEFIRGRVSQAREHFIVHPPRGEFVLVIGGASPKGFANPSDLTWDDARIKSQVKRLMKRGISRTDAVKRVAQESKRNRRHVYQLALSKSHQK